MRDQNGNLGAFAEAYARAIYWVDLPHADNVRRLRAFAAHPELDDYLRTWHPATNEWAFLTAWNPRSTILPVVENQRRQAALEQMLRQQKRTFFSGEGRSPQGERQWREPSFFVLGMSPEQARALGRTFQQNAVLVGRLGGEARLEFVEPG